MFKEMAHTDNNSIIGASIYEVLFKTDSQKNTSFTFPLYMIEAYKIGVGMVFLRYKFQINPTRECIS